MSMIAEHSVWPPKPMDRVYKHVDLLHAWWTGDLEKLDRYSGSAGQPAMSRWQYNGGVGGMVARGIFGAPPRAGQKTRRLHVPIAADVSRAMASVMAGDPPRFSIGEGGANEAAFARLDKLVNTARFHSGLLGAEETAAALGGYYAKVCWNTDLHDSAWMTFHDPDSALPEFTYDMLSAVTFWTELPSDGKGDVWRHLERHSPGRIEHALFCGSDDNLGMRRPLPDHPATEDIMVDAESGIETGTRLLTAGFIPNVMPNPEWRRDPVLKMLGRADITTQMMDTMSALNDAYSSLARDIRLAKARLVVDESMLRTGRPGEGSFFDPDHEAFTTVKQNPGDESSLIEAHQFAIRVEEHEQAINLYTRQVIRSAGLSPLTFGLKDDAVGQMTATEVGARERSTNATKAGKALLRRDAFSRLVRAMIEVDAAVFGTGAQIGEQVAVEYTPASSPSPEELARTAQLLDQARAASTETKVRLYNPDWDDDAVAQEVDKILSETGQGALMDPFDTPADQSFTVASGGPLDLDSGGADMNEAADAA
ncbi:phage portal protein [Dietzia sp. SLG510A3-30A2]|nr:phage portal protein [Dietzia sp. SLG510A3-30A2]